MSIWVKRHAFSVFSMAAGSFMVFFVVFVMNRQKVPTKAEGIESQTQFEVQKKKPPKKKKRPERRSKPKPRRSAAKAPKVPNLSSAISQADFELAGFNASNLGNVSQDLIGKFDKRGAMAEGAVDKLPKARRRVHARYPKDAQKRGIEGHVQFNVFVTADGEVGKVKVIGAKPKGVFEQHAKEAMRDWEFRPGEYEGEPVGVWIKQKIVFKLQKS